MAIENPQELYKRIKQKPTAYLEELHCPMVLKLISETGRVSAFCMSAIIKEWTFYEWVNKHETFSLCYNIAKMYAQEEWEKEYEDNCKDPEWDKAHWKSRGSRYFAKRAGSIMLAIDHAETPWIQYQQIMKQASQGAFAAEEIKQLMESVNVGTRVFEAFKLQEDVDKMNKELQEMGQRNGDNTLPASKVAQTYKATV